MAATIYDVARESGVAFSTAAAALRGAPHVRVATRRRVAAALASRRRRPSRSRLSVAWPPPRARAGP